VLLGLVFLLGTAKASFHYWVFAQCARYAERNHLDHCPNGHAELRWIGYDQAQEMHQSDDSKIWYWESDPVPDAPVFRSKWNPTVG
jgi:hypothetical protein